MAKRIAEKELTDRNWDQEDEGEEVNDTLSLTKTNRWIILRLSDNRFVSKKMHFETCLQKVLISIKNSIVLNPPKFFLSSGRNVFSRKRRCDEKSCRQESQAS